MVSLIISYEPICSPIVLLDLPPEDCYPTINWYGFSFCFFRAKEKLGCSFVRFNEDGSAEIVYGPLNPIKEFGEKRVWFHHLVDRNEGDTNHCFGDGTPIPRSALDAYRKIVSENCVDIKWQKGDVLLVDNFCAQHARRAGDAPRVVLVSICK